jgi:hypothetical protein
VTQYTVSMLAYRSRALTPPTERELEVLVRKAQERNHIEGLTGLLIYDQGHFFQWLEGPSAGLARVWESIRRDPRHRDVQVLREQLIPKRFFGDWDMRLALRARGLADEGLSLVRPNDERPAPMPGQSIALGMQAWDDIFADVVVPKLKADHVPLPSPVALLWHAQAEAPATLAGLLLAVDAGATAQYVSGLVEQGASLETLYREVFEPAARYLGGLWYEDEKSDAEITLGLGRLQLEVRRLSASFAHPLHIIKPGHSVLVAPQPGEPHAVHAAMSSELFWRDGWDVSYEFPGNDGVLRELVHDSWFDVLDLSMSGAYRRDHQLADLGVSIRAARAASLNPALAVIVNGRAFFERPQAYFGIGADAACVTVIESVATAQRLLDTLATQDRIEQSLLDPTRSEHAHPVTVLTHRRLTVRRFGARSRSHSSAVRA